MIVLNEARVKYVLLDINMPKLNGDEVVNHIRITEEVQDVD